MKYVWACVALLALGGCSGGMGDEPYSPWDPNLGLSATRPAKNQTPTGPESRPSEPLSRPSADATTQSE